MPAFVVLLLVYMGYSWHEELDARLPIATAFLLLIAAVAVAAAGAVGTANTIAIFVFLLLGAGVTLLAAGRLRERRRRRSGGEPPEVGAQPSDYGNRTPDHLLHRLEEHPVAVIEAPRDQHGQDEEPGDAEDEGR